MINNLDNSIINFINKYENKKNALMKECLHGEEKDFLDNSLYIISTNNDYIHNLVGNNTLRVSVNSKLIDYLDTMSELLECTLIDYSSNNKKILVMYNSYSSVNNTIKRIMC